MCANNLVCPDKRPAIGMQLGRGNIKLSKKLPLKASKGKLELNLLEHGCVNKAKRVTIVALAISTNGFPARTRTNNNLVIMLLMERQVGLISQAKNVSLRVNRGSLIQQGWRSPGIQQSVIRNGAGGGVSLWGS